MAEATIWGIHARKTGPGRPMFDGSIASVYKGLLPLKRVYVPEPSADDDE